MCVSVCLSVCVSLWGCIAGFFSVVLVFVCFFARGSKQVNQGLQGISFALTAGEKGRSEKIPAVWRGAGILLRSAFAHFLCAPGHGCWDPHLWGSSLFQVLTQVEPWGPQGRCFSVLWAL